MKLLAFSGKKQSGKNSMFNSMLGLEMMLLNIVQGSAKVMQDGKLHVTDIFGDDQFAGIFDIDRPTESMRSFSSDFIHPFIKSFSFADTLKQKVCIDLLGLEHHQVYGSDEEKNTPTHLRWENMLGVVTDKELVDFANSEEVSGRLGEYYTRLVNGLIYHEPGFMTGRDVMQFFGSEFFRKAYETIWIDNTIKDVNNSTTKMAVITDCRFPNEVAAIHKAGGKVIRLTRNNDSPDKHISENLLNKDVYDWNNFDHILDNEDMTMFEQEAELFELLKNWEWLQ